jgi:hypothetical protein
LKNGNRKSTNKRVKEYHNVIKQERKPGPLDHPDGAGGMVDYPAGPGKRSEMPISVAIFLFSLCKICLTNYRKRAKNGIFENILKNLCLTY